MKQVRSVALVTFVAAILSGCAMTSYDTRSDPEREIFIQAIMTGGLIGAGTGAAIGAAADKENRARGAAVGAAVGGTIGVAVGYYAAERQLQNLRICRMENQRLTNLLNTAERRNREVAEYNRKLKAEIASLAGKRSEIAAALKDANQERKRVQQTISTRQSLATKLVPGQRAQYEKKLQYLQQQDQQLEDSIKKLEHMEQAIVG